MHNKFRLFLQTSYADCSLQCAQFKKYYIRCFSTLTNSNVLLKLTKKLKIDNRRSLIMSRKQFDPNPKLMKKDKVPEGYELIYKASMINYIKYCSYIILGTNLTIPIILGYSYTNYIGLTKPYAYGPKDRARKILPKKTYETVIFFCCFIVLNLSLIIFYRKYALRIYNSGTNYVAIYSDGIRPWKTSQHYFTDAVKKDLRVRIIVDSYYDLGGKKSILMEDGFRYPIDYHKMLNLD